MQLCFFFLRFNSFDELEISPLTIKALTLAGYAQMTGVQEAAISVVLDGTLTIFFWISCVLLYVRIVMWKVKRIRF